MSRLELIDLRHEVRRQGIQLEQQIALQAAESQFELTREIIKVRQEIEELKMELHQARLANS